MRTDIVYAVVIMVAFFGGIWYGRWTERQEARWKRISSNRRYREYRHGQYVLFRAWNYLTERNDSFDSDRVMWRAWLDVGDAIKAIELAD